MYWRGSILGISKKLCWSFEKRNKTRLLRVGRTSSWLELTHLIDLSLFFQPFICTAVFFSLVFFSHLLKTFTCSSKWSVQPSQVSWLLRWNHWVFFFPFWLWDCSVDFLVFLIHRIKWNLKKTGGRMQNLQGESHQVNPLHPNISMQTLHTMLYTFPKGLTRRICLTIKSFSFWSFPLFLYPKCVIQGWYCKEKLDTNHS